MNFKNRFRLIAFFCVTFCSFELHSQSHLTHQPFEFFPLRVGLIQTYRYYSNSITSEFGLVLDHSKDSGLVKFAIQDSSLFNDSTVVWSVQEIDNIFQVRSIPFRQPHADTSYWRADTSTHQLYEKITGNHEIIGFTNGSISIWKFPTDWGKSQTFRYYDSTHLTVTNNRTGFETNIGSFNETLIFLRETGLKELTFNSDRSNITISSTEKKVRLLTTGTTDIEKTTFIPKGFSLYQNFPNPFNSETLIFFSLLKTSRVKVEIFDVLGHAIKLLLDEVRPAGYHTVRFDADGLSTGVYFYMLIADETIATNKMIFIK